MLQSQFMLHVMLFPMLHVLCLPAVCVQCPVWLFSIVACFRDLPVSFWGISLIILRFITIFIILSPSSTSRASHQFSRFSKQYRYHWPSTYYCITDQALIIHRSFKKTLIIRHVLSIATSWIRIYSADRRLSSFELPCITCLGHYPMWVAILNYLITPWCRVLLEKLTGLQLVKKFPAFHGTRRFITALTRVRHLSLSWASPIQSTCPHPTSWRYDDITENI